MSRRADMIYIFIWIFVVQVAGSYIKTPYKTSWTNATQNCSIATPSILFNSSTKDLSVNVSTSLAEGHPWIGYCKVPRAFEYIGCMKIENRTPFFENVQNTPGLCYSACDKGRDILVGVSGSNCFCLNQGSIADFGLDNCNDTCKKQPDITCGGVNHISIYRLTSTVVPNPNEDATSQCFQYQINTISQPFWTTCGMSLQTMCSFKNQSILFASVKLPYTETYLPWTKSMHLCFKNSGYPVLAENFTIFENTSKLTPIWTGISKSDVIYKFSEMDEILPVKCGYLSKAEENVVVKFTNINAAKYVLCNIATSTSQTTTASTYSSTLLTTPGYQTESSSVTSTSVKEITFTSKENVTSTTISTDTESNVGKEKDSTDSDVSTVVATSTVSVLVFIAVVVVVIVILRKRNKLPFLRNEDVPDGVFEQSKRTEDERTHVNHDYDHTSAENTANNVSDNDYANTYFVLEPYANEPSSDNATYDTSGIAIKTIPENNNVYNTLDLDNTKTYDHTHTKLKNGIVKSEDTYDTMGGVAMKLKARSNAFGETDEDEYNHITSNSIKNSQTENEYGMINNFDNEYGDVFAHNKNGTHDEQETYNHIGNRPQISGEKSSQLSASRQMFGSNQSEQNQDEH